MTAREFNFDGLVGPTHNYAGLSLGNVASLKNAQGQSNPKQAALEGLAKMKALHDLGMPQAILAPMERPDVFTLRSLGFTGTDSEVLQKTSQQAPELLIACSSASSMWTANACTVSPSADCADGRLHITPANLANKFHRAIEHPTTGRILKAIFEDDNYFAHHPALPSGDHFGDEGAANHSRLCTSYGAPGVEFFVFGKYAFDQSKVQPKRFPARQTYEASKAICRLHGLDESAVVIAQQAPETIDAGVFHNDVIAVANEHVLFCHEQAFVNQQHVYDELSEKFPQLQVIEVPSKHVSLEDAVTTYLFNSQLISHPEKGMILIAPSECLSNENVNNYLNDLISTENAINDVQMFQVQQSMKNGGGPACLRQRIVLTEKEVEASNQSVFMTEERYTELCDWVNKHYRDRLAAEDLADPELLIETRSALNELTTLLDLGAVYPFQL